MELEKNEPKTLYELSSVTISEDGASVKTLLAKHNAQIVNEGPVIKIQLAYKINKQGFGFMGTLDFFADTASVAALQREIIMDADVVRAIIVKKKESKKSEAKEGKDEAVAPSAPRKIRDMLGFALSNEALEKKIEEILQ